MELGGQITFEGKNGLFLIQGDKENGLVEVYLKNDDGNDMILYFDPALFASILELGVQFLNTGETQENLKSKTCRAKPDLNLWIDDEDVSIKVDCGNPDEDNPNLIITSKRYGQIEVGLNVNQAAMIAYCCKKIIEIKEGLADLGKSKLVSAKT